MFQFKSEKEAQWVLKEKKNIGIARKLQLERWSESVGCLEGMKKMEHRWICVVGIPMKLRCKALFRKIGELCSGFIALGAGAMNYTVKIKVQGAVPPFISVEDGSGVYKAWVKVLSPPEIWPINLAAGDKEKKGGSGTIFVSGRGQMTRQEESGRFQANTAVRNLESGRNQTMRQKEGR